MIFLILFIFSLKPSTLHAQDVISDLWMDLPQAYMDYEVIEASLLIQTPEGFLYRISRMMTVQEDQAYSVCFTDSNALYNVVPIYWGESYVQASMQWFKETWGEVKAFLVEILEKVKEMIDIVGVLVIFIASGFLTYFLNQSLPAFPPKVVFYSIFGLVCFLWVSLVSVQSVIYATGVLLVHYLVIAVLGLGYRKTLGRLKKGNA